MDCAILAEQDRGLIFSGGVGYITIFDVVSNMEVTHVQIEGRVSSMRFGPSKKKLLVSSVTKDGINYYNFDI